MSTAIKTTNRKRLRKDETESEESDYDTYSDDDSDSDDSNSESDDAEKSKEVRPSRAAVNPSLRRRRKLEPCVLDSLLWHDLDFQEDFKLFLKPSDVENDTEGGVDENENEEDGDEDLEEEEAEVPAVVVKTEPRSDVESEDESKVDDGSFILPDVTSKKVVPPVKIKSEPGTEPETKKARTGLKNVGNSFPGEDGNSSSLSAGTSRNKKNGPATKPRKVQWERFQGLDGRSNQEKTPFSGKPGRAPETVRCENLNVLFKLFFTSEIQELIAEQTNKNAEGKNPKDPWTNLTPAELMAFIAINIAMGTDRRETLSSYWSTYPVLHSPWFGSIMSRQRFRDIHRYLTLDSDSKGPFIFHKVEPLMKFLPIQFKKLNSPSRWLVIDEQVLGTKCKMSYLQNLGLPTRPVEWGLKVFTLSDALTGYILNCYVHPGRAHDLDIHPHGLAYDIVMKLLEDYHGKGYVVFMDNFYTSTQLFLDLLDKGTLACGISRPDRKGFPDTVANTQLNPGATTYRQAGDLTALKWAGTADVCCMSTYFGWRSVTRQQGSNIPEMLSMYNNYMGNVNVSDQPLCYFSLIRKPISWWRKVFWRLVDVTLVNIVALRRLEGLKLTNTSLRKQLVIELVKPHLAESNMHPYEPIQADSGQLVIPVGHLPIKAEKRGQCTSCSKDKVKNFCTGCQKYVCTGCYESYHINMVIPDTMEYSCSPGSVIPD